MKIKVEDWSYEYWGFVRQNGHVLWLMADRLQEIHNALNQVDRQGCIATDRKLRKILRKAIIVI